MNLCIYRDRYVLVQLKQPYQLVMTQAKGDKPMPMSIPVPGAAPPPPGQEPERTLLTVPFVMGKVKVVIADHGHEVAFVQFMDANNVKMEIKIADDMIFSVTAVSQDTIVTL